MPQAKLLEFLEGIGDGSIGMDCSIRPTKFKDIFLVSTTDFFYPLIEDPYVQGKIACANVLSDLYALGVVDCDNMLMLLATSSDMPLPDRDVCTKLLIKGFNDLALEAGTSVTGGQTVVNPWPVIGGVAMSTQKEEGFIRPENAVPGDVLILTKPIGIQVAVNAHQWLEIPEKWARIDDVVTREQVIDTYEFAAKHMSRLNKNGAILMHKYGAHGATDVTGFGLMGHANNLAKNQKAKVRFEIDTLPILAHMKTVVNKVGIFKLFEGLSAETSGGLLLTLPEDKAKAFCEEIEQLDGYPAWIIGRVVERSDDQQNEAVLVPNPTLLDIYPPWVAATSSN